MLRTKRSLPRQNGLREDRSLHPDGNHENSDSSSDGDRGSPRVDSKIATDTVRFDLKLKSGDVPEWDGNEDSLGLWILKLNLARAAL